jgi:hypothetical protein
MQHGYILNDWDLIVATMHWSGAASTALREADYGAVMAEGDGYGKMTAAELRARGLECDWSHVRDSSPAAMCAMAAKIREVLGGPALLRVQQRVAENDGQAVVS